MITETAIMTVTAGSEADFEAAMVQARPLVEASPGCLGLQVRRGIERPQSYLLTIGWDSLADHLEGFRGSPAFARWRELLSPFYAEPAVVEHWEPTAT